MSTSTPTQQVAVSYAWKEEDTGASAEVVDGFCTRLRAAGIKVLRDVDGIKLGDSLSGFMRKIGKSDFLCLFLTDSYLRSPNCMYELLIAWEKSKDDPVEFRQRVKVWVMPSAEGVYKPETRITYVRYWKGERDRLSLLIQELATDGLSPAELETFRRVKQFAEHVNDMLCFFADSLSPSRAEDFENWILESFPATKGPTAAQLEAVYVETRIEIDLALGSSATVGSFLEKATRGLISKDATGFRLDAEVLKPPFDAWSHLGAIEKALPAYLPQMMGQDLEVLEVCAGGITVLGVDPHWTWQQRNLAGATLDYPGLKDTVVAGDAKADFLHIVVAALADGHARLRRVFGEVPQTKEEGRSIPPPAEIFGSTNEDEKEIELMAHFVNVLTKEKTDLSRPAEVRLLFNQVKANMNYEAGHYHNPYHGTGEGFRLYSPTIRKFLEPQDCWLLFPSGKDSEDALLTRSIWVIRHLQSIFTQIKKRRAQLQLAL